MEGSALSLRYETVDGEPITVGARTLRPQSDVLRVSWPNGGWVLNHPRAVAVEEAGVTQEIAIPDITRWGLLGMVVLTIVFVLIGIKLTGIKLTGIKRR